MENYALFKAGEAKDGEDEDIKKNRPFHVFVVKQMTYAY
jgi:protein-serine/threonine kinase